MERPTVIDLFCGVGGLTLGAARAGFDLAAAVDTDPRTEISFTANFPRSKFIRADIAGLDARELRARAGLEGKVVHGVIGGPPCQGFSRLGHRGLDDARNSLFDHFLRLVCELRPCFYVLENVVGVLDSQYQDILRRAFSRLDGYRNLEPLSLNASLFGAATSRERIFFVGYIPDRMNPVAESDFGAPPEVERVVVETALRGLPRRIDPEWRSGEHGWRSLTCRPEGAFWQKTFGHIPDGAGAPRAVQQLNDANRVSGCVGTRHTAAVTSRFAKLAEGAADGPSRAIRLQRNGFCPTLRAGTGPERGSFQALRPIHPTEPRVITPREAARLQGFPDWFVFDHTKWHSFRQIGNSVSPILAENTMKTIAEKLGI